MRNIAISDKMFYSCNISVTSSGVFIAFTSNSRISITCIYEPFENTAMFVIELFKYMSCVPSGRFANKTLYDFCNILNITFTLCSVFYAYQLVVKNSIMNLDI